MWGKRGTGAAGPWGGWLPGVLSAVRRVAGMPDYGAYLEHLRRYHPERTAPSEREFYEEYVRARYADGPTRCC
jgi:uncharacterized short protein YbdD (DUF466 family)